MTKFNQIAAAPGIPAITDTVLGVGSATTDYQYSISQLIAALGLRTLPQGRLTLQSGVPVQNADQIAKTTVYYDSYAGNSVVVWNGVQWVSLVITSDEISMGLDGGAPHIASGSVYDIFAINNSGSLAIAVGPAWSSLVSRGSGAGTTELQRFNGIWTNKNSLTHAWGGASGVTDYGAVSVNQATLLGSLYATANGQTGVALVPSPTSGGSNNIIGLYNAYNQVPAIARCQDNEAGYNYSATTWRASGGSNSNRITWLDGLQNVFIEADFQTFFQSSVLGDAAVIGVTLDSTSNAPPNCARFSVDTASRGRSPFVRSTFYPALGLHFVSSMEAAAVASGTISWGTTSTSPTQQLANLNVQLVI